jgi:HK97 family phage portal protein
VYAVTNPATKDIIQLFSLPADQVKIVAGSYTDPIKGYKFDGLSKEMLDKNLVAHWKYVNPIWQSNGSGLYGMSPLKAASRVINNDNSGVDSETASFTNEGVKGIITGTNDKDIDFTKEQADELLKKFRKYNEQARKGKGNLAFNRAPINYHKIGETPVDMGVLDSRKFNKEILANIFRVHPSLLSTDASTLDNFQTARKALMTMSVLPDLDNLRDKLNNLVRRFYGEQYYIDYDIMAIDELQEDLEKKAKTLNSMDWITPNEKRRATNYDDYESEAADRIYTDMGQVPLGMSMDTSIDEEDKQIEELRKQFKNQ